MDRLYCTAGVLELAAFLLFQLQTQAVRNIPVSIYLELSLLLFIGSTGKKSLTKAVINANMNPEYHSCEEVPWSLMWRLGSCGPTGPAVTGTSQLLHRAQDNMEWNADSWVVPSLALLISANLMSWLPPGESSLR